MINIISPLGDDMRDYLHDETKATGFARSISFPECENDVAATLRALYADKIPVTVQGNRTGLTAGAVPYGGHIMSMTRMTRVLGLRIDEGGTVFARVQPGLSLGVFRQMLAQRSFALRRWHWLQCRQMSVMFLKYKADKRSRIWYTYTSNIERTAVKTYGRKRKSCI